MFPITGNKVAYDYDTKNKSFREVSAQLKKAGVKNYKFMLEIHNKELLKIDPLDPELPLLEQRLVLEECMINPWYFLREIVRIPTQGGTTISYHATKGNITQTWCILNDLDSWRTADAQSMKTMSLMALFVWVYIFTGCGTNISLLHRTKGDAKKNLFKIKEIILALPPRIFKNVTNGFYVNNAERIQHVVSGSIVDTKPQVQSTYQAMNLGRSLMHPIQHFDDAGFIKYLNDILLSELPVYDALSNICRKNCKGICARVFTCIDISSKKYDKSKYVQEARKIIDNMITWHDFMFDYSYENLHKVVQNATGYNGIFHIMDDAIPTLSAKELQEMGMPTAIDPSKLPLIR